MTTSPTGKPLRCVLDASIALKWVLDEAGSDMARELLGRLPVHDTRCHVPSFFFIELANVLWKNTRRRVISANEAQDALALLRALPLIVHPVEALAGAALDVSISHGVAAYDAAYVALAASTGLPFVTADEKLWCALHNVDKVVLLGDETL